MRYLVAPRRFVLGTASALILLTLLVHRSLFLSSSSPFWSPSAAIATECQVWPTLGFEQPSYEKCQGRFDFPAIGDPHVLGDPEWCLPAASRLDQYQSSPGRNWSKVKWGQTQRRCAIRGYQLSPLESDIRRIWHLPAGSEEVKASLEGGKGRVAIVLRTWDNYEYTERRLSWLRALIAEVSLQHHGKYQVFFLVNIKNPDIPLEHDDVAYEHAMLECVPEEFRDMAILFNERTLKAWYPLVPEHGAQDQMYQALQIFSRKFQQFDYIWQLEMDMRSTSHVHDTLESAASFARAQRRRNLWERNGRFYIPQLHNSYENFSAVIDAEIEDRGIWGPASTTDFISQGQKPPSRTTRDWGVGEDADLISFMPMIDPVGTSWIYEDAINGFEDGLNTPRRVAIVSMTRSSRRLVNLIDEAQRERGQWLVSEATLETFALLHGLKAVTVPHPIYFTKEIGATELDTEINKGPLYCKAGGEMPSMLYSKKGWVPGPWWEASYWFTGSGAQGIWNAYVGGQSFPPMLLHPVKET